MTRKINRAYTVSYADATGNCTRAGAVWDKSLAIPYVGISGWREMLAGEEVEGVDGEVYWIERG